VHDLDVVAAGEALGVASREQLEAWLDPRRMLGPST